MAFYIPLFCRAPGTTADAIGENLHQRLREANTALATPSTSCGIGWCGYEFSSPERGGSSITIEVQAPPTPVPSWNWTPHNDHGLHDRDVVIQLTLVGDDIDWGLVTAVWAVAKETWSAVPFVDGSGFDAQLDSLP